MISLQSKWRSISLTKDSFSAQKCNIFRAFEVLFCPHLKVGTFLILDNPNCNLCAHHTRHLLDLMAVRSDFFKDNLSPQSLVYGHP